MSRLWKWFDGLIHGVKEPGECERCGKWTEDAHLFGHLVDIDLRTGKTTKHRDQDGNVVKIHVCQQCYRDHRWYYHVMSA